MWEDSLSKDSQIRTDDTREQAILIDDLWGQNPHTMEYLERENARLRAKIAALYAAIATQQAEFMETLREFGIVTDDETYSIHCANADQKIAGLERNSRSSSKPPSTDSIRDRQQRSPIRESRCAR